MGKIKDISPEEKTRMQCWLHKGVKNTEIAARLGRHPGMLTPKTPPTPAKCRPGPKGEETARMVNRQALYVKRNSFKTGCELRNEEFGWSHVLVRRIPENLLKKLYLPFCVAAEKPMLTTKILKKRLSFCKKYCSWTQEQWRRVMFSEESTFRLVNPRGAR